MGLVPSMQALTAMRHVIYLLFLLQEMTPVWLFSFMQILYGVTASLPSHEEGSHEVEGDEFEGGEDSSHDRPPSPKLSSPLTPPLLRRRASAPCP
jgi:hypothetical protein